MEMPSAPQVPTPARKKSKRLSQWELIKAARSFYGRPLGPDDLRKIRVTQEMVSQPRPRLRAVPRPVGAAGPDHAQRMHRAGESDVPESSIEGAA